MPRYCRLPAGWRVPVWSRVRTGRSGWARSGTPSDKQTGRELWRALTARELGYCPPVIFEAGGRRQLIVWHPESLNSLDPETGKVVWSHPAFAYRCIFARNDQEILCASLDRRSSE